MSDFCLEGSPKLAGHLAVLWKKERISLQGEGINLWSQRMAWMSEV